MTQAKRVIAISMSFCLLAAWTPVLAVAACCGEIGLSPEKDPLALGMAKVGKPTGEAIENFTASKNIKIGTPAFVPAEFTEGKKDTCKGKPLAAGNKCEVGVIFTPSKLGRETGFLSFSYEIEATKCTPEESVELEGAGE